ncbi:MAG: ABC transporter ATP-binding protein [Dethiobacteria bacterium]
MILSVNNVDFRYPSHNVLKNVKFEVERGDCLAILGTNGVGKSTLLKCINKILRPQQGVITVEKDEISKLSLRKVAQKIGYVSQRQESGRFTVFDAVILGRKPHITWDVTERDMAIVNHIIKMLGLESFSLRYIDELSGGELQKVVIARALAQEPRVLLLDEPTSNLDLKNQLDVLNIIQNVVREQQIAAIVTMHDLNLAIRFANKFIFLKKGTIFAAGGFEIITPEIIEEVYAVPVAVESFRAIPVVVPL